MLVRNVTRDELDAALAQTNTQFDNNITYKRCPHFAGHTREHSTKYNLTLTVRNSHNAGARRSIESRRIAAACWHAHRAFLTHLPRRAVVVSAFGTWSHGTPFLDPQVGSAYYPASASELCECGN